MPKRLLDYDRDREQRTQDRLMTIIERKFAPRIAREIRRASKIMVREYVMKRGGMPSLPPDHASNLEQIFMQMIDLAIQRFSKRIINQGKSLGLLVETKDFAEDFRGNATYQVLMEAVRKKITNVSETTRTNIYLAIDKNHGKPINDIASAILSESSITSRARATVIARTETHGAANFGANEAAKATGLKLQKEWVASNDERTRSAHAAADGDIVEMDQPFTVGGEKLMFPGDPDGSAGNVINCRCAVAHIVDEESSSPLPPPEYDPATNPHHGEGAFQPDPTDLGFEGDGDRDDDYDIQLSNWSADYESSTEVQKGQTKNELTDWLFGARHNLQHWRDADVSKVRSRTKDLIDSLPVRKGTFWRGTLTNQNAFQKGQTFTFKKLSSFSSRKGTAEVFLRRSSAGDLYDVIDEANPILPTMIKWIGRGSEFGDILTVTGAAKNQEFEALMRAGQKGIVESVIRTQVPEEVDMGDGRLTIEVPRVIVTIREVE